MCLNLKIKGIVNGNRNQVYKIRSQFTTFTAVLYRAYIFHILLYN